MLSNRRENLGNILKFGGHWDKIEKYICVIWRKNIKIFFWGEEKCFVRIAEKNSRRMQNFAVSAERLLKRLHRGGAGDQRGTGG